MRTLTIFTLSVALLFQAGCGGNDGRPADMPKLYSVRITVTQDGNPLDGATVTLVANTPSTYGESSGTTDASGVATMMTYGYAGVPADDYAVRITKSVVEGATERLTEEGRPIMTGGQLFQYVEERYTQTNTTPHSLTVTDRAVTETFDVGSPVRVFMRAIPD